MIELQPDVRTLLQYIVFNLPATEPDWVQDSETVIGHIYHEAVHLLHQDSDCLTLQCVEKE